MEPATFSDDEKIRQLEAFVAADPADHLGLFMLGKLYLDAGRHADAAAAYERVLVLDPNYSAAYRYGGDAYRKAGEDARAEDLYRRGIAVAEARGDLQTAKEMKVFLRKVTDGE